MNISDKETRFWTSTVVFITVAAIVFPNMMEGTPPLLVNVLLWPLYAVGWLYRLVSHPNNDQHFREGTPIDMLIGLVMISFCVFLYPVLTYVILSLISKKTKAEKIELAADKRG